MSSFENRTVLITGGTGSFGSTMVRHLLENDVGSIRILSRDEKKQHDMREELDDPRVQFYLGDVRDSDTVDSVMHGVDHVFNAAALKQVPSCEFFPLEAVKTNVLGVENVLNSAIRRTVKSVVVLSTDKAVYPINVMGQTKALMEKVAISKSRGFGKTHNTKINVTRYGNVIGSRGSVIPFFVKAAKNQQPLKVTDNSMTRFFMSLRDAVDLVEYAMLQGQNGDVLVKKSPGASIAMLVRSVLEICQSKSTIENIGIRHGEKRHESLLSVEEMAIAQDLGAFYRCPSDDRDLNYKAFFTEGGLNFTSEGYTSENTKQLSIDELNHLLTTNKEIQEYLD